MLPQLILIPRRKGDRAALKSLAHFCRMLSVWTARRNSPLPALAIPSHMAVETLFPIPRVKTLRGALDDRTHSATSAVVSSTSYAYVRWVRQISHIKRWARHTSPSVRRNTAVGMSGGEVWNTVRSELLISVPPWSARIASA